jgi:shikimate kinase
MNIILFGFKGAGKSYLGKLLSERLQLHFIDTDRLIEERNGLSCREIALKIGLDGFRVLEKEIILDLKSTKSVISIGGGTLLDSDNVNHLKTLGHFIYLDTSKEVLKKRWAQDKMPAFFSFEEMYRERQPVFEKIEAIRVKTDNKTVAEILDEAILQLF